MECNRERDGGWVAKCWSSHGCVSIDYQRADTSQMGALTRAGDKKTEF